MVKKLNIEELDPTTLAKLGIGGDGHIDKKVIVLGRVLNAISKLTVTDANWVLRTAGRHVAGREETKRGARRKAGEKAPDSPAET